MCAKSLEWSCSIFARCYRKFHRWELNSYVNRPHVFLTTSTQIAAASFNVSLLVGCWSIVNCKGPIHVAELFKCNVYTFTEYIWKMLDPEKLFSINVILIHTYRNKINCLHISNLDFMKK